MRWLSVPLVLACIACGGAIGAAFVVPTTNTRAAAVAWLIGCIAAALMLRALRMATRKFSKSTEGQS